MLNVAGPALAFLVALTAILGNFSLHKIEEGRLSYGVLYYCSLVRVNVK